MRPPDPTLEATEGHPAHGGWCTGTHGDAPAYLRFYNRDRVQLLEQFAVRWPAPIQNRVTLLSTILVRTIWDPRR